VNTNPSTIGIVIAAKNEEKVIERCLASVSWADEIVLVDDQSTDRTSEIAKRFGARVITRRLDSFSAQKQAGLNSLGTEWVLVLDADEVVTDALKDEILHFIKDVNDSISGAFIPRRNYIGDYWVRCCGWWPDYHLRLFRKVRGQFNSRIVHESIVISGGKILKLNNPIEHFSYRNIDELYKKARVYAVMRANELYRAGVKTHWYNIFLEPTAMFLKKFILQGGCLAGRVGYAISMSTAKGIRERYLLLKRCGNVKMERNNAYTKYRIANICLFATLEGNKFQSDLKRIISEMGRIGPFRGPRNFKETQTSGRRAVQIITTNNGSQVVLRWYYHGGILAPLFRGLFWGKSRATRELVVVQAARTRGIPTPQVLGAIEWRWGLLYRAALMTEYIPDSITLTEFISREKSLNVRKQVFGLVAEVLAKMHDNGIFHQDLNTKNILIQENNSTPKVWFIDLDRAEIKNRMELRERLLNLSRLGRSVMKQRLVLSQREKLQFLTNSLTGLKLSQDKLKNCAKRCETISRYHWF